jgi:hypothetical protein
MGNVATTVGVSSETTATRLFWLLMAVSTPLFGLICYNSGLGSDPLEYFTIGRAYAEGQPFFSFIHTKSFGMYAFVAWMMMLGVEFNHVDNTLVVTGLYVLTTGATYLVFVRHFGGWPSLMACALVGVSNLFMEQV